MPIFDVGSAWIDVDRTGVCQLSAWRNIRIFSPAYSDHVKPVTATKSSNGKRTKPIVLCFWIYLLCLIWFFLDAFRRLYHW
ncbi:hypothetical protein D3C80_1679920 [compost metagenome]